MYTTLSTYWSFDAQEPLVPPKSKLSLAEPEITEVFEKSGKRIFRAADIGGILLANSRRWKLPESTTTNKFIAFLKKTSNLREERIEFSYRPVTRYTWGEVDVWPIVQSINVEGYFSHYSAVQFHGLTEQLPKSVYFNQEQSLAGGGGQLTQQGLDVAFRGKCRVTNNVAPFRDRTIHLLNGRNTGRLGVIPSKTSAGDEIQVTGIERTLIDIVVRPIYSGGIFEVAKAFALAHGRFSVNKLVAMLKQSNFTYPYHQSIGYLMERSGAYKPAQLDLLRELPMDYDFYIDYGLKNRDYDPRWKLFIPKGF